MQQAYYYCSRFKGYCNGISVSDYMKHEGCDGEIEEPFLSIIFLAIRGLLSDDKW